MKKSYGAIIGYALVLILVFFLMSSLVTGTAEKQKEITSTEFTTMLEAGELDYAYIAEIRGEYYLVGVKKGAEFDPKKQDVLRVYDYRAQFVRSGEAVSAMQATFQQYVNEGKLKGAGSANNNTIPWYEQMMPYLLLVGALAAVFFFMYQQNKANGKAMQFGRANARLYAEGKTKVTFGDVAGADEEKEELAELVDFLKNPRRFAEMGARIPKGVLLVGSPGTGKTLLAKAVAGEAGVPFFSITGSDFVELYVGIGASRVRDLFAQAKKNAPSIIFIDEIDAVGRRRGAGLGGGHDEREQTLNQLLVEMDGFNNNEGIIVLAATNRADILDPALLRSGRFDRQVHVLNPDAQSREAIFRVHMRNKKLDETVDPEEVSKLTVGFTGADIENLINEASLLAVRREKKTVSMQEIRDSITKVLMGPEKKSRIITPEEKKMLAYHEAGHAVASYTLPNGDPVSEVSIISRGRAGGYTLMLPEKDTLTWSKAKMQDELVTLLSGRVAEEIVLKDISTGASSDIKRATEIARSMVAEYGMDEAIGPVYLGDGAEIFLGRDFSAQKHYSDIWAAKVDNAVHRVLEGAYNRARELLTTHRDKLDRCADLLLEKEKISAEEFANIMQDVRPAQESPEAPPSLDAQPENA